MKKIYNIIAVAIVAVTLAACSVSTNIVTTNGSCEKQGTATRTIWFGLAFGTTDVSIATAAKNGGITQIGTVDFEQYVGLFRTKYTTIVTGN